MQSHQARLDFPSNNWGGGTDGSWEFDIILKALLCANTGIDELADAVWPIRDSYKQVTLLLGCGG